MTPFQSRTKGFLNTDTDTDTDTDADADKDTDTDTDTHTDTDTDTEYLGTISKNLSVRVLCWDNHFFD